LSTKLSHKDLDGGTLTVDSTKNKDMLEKLILGAPKVSHRQTQLLRIQLLDMRALLLSRCDEIVEKMVWPFGKNNLKSNLVFSDLVSIHLD